MSTPVSIATVPTHVAGDTFTAGMWESLQDNLNQGVVEQVGVNVERAANQSVASATLTTLSFDTLIRDVYGMWSAGSPTVLTAPVSGWYRVTAYVDWAATNGGGGPLELRFLVNGTQKAVGSTAIQGDNTHTTQQLESCDVYCNAGDAVTMTVLQRTGSALNVVFASVTLVRV